MAHNLKAPGLALFAAFALGALGAGAAAADVFVAEPSSTVLTAEDHTEAHSFEYGLGTVECEVTNFAGEAPTIEETEIAITPTYDKCTLFSDPAVVRTNHCYYVFTSHTDEGGHAPVHVECENAEEHIEVEVVETGCTVTVAPQTEHAGGVSFTNEGSGSEADVTVDITAEVEATRDNPTDDFLCSFLPSSDTGKYTGNSTLKGYEYASGPSTGWTKDNGHQTAGTGTTHWSWGEGDQVGVSVDDTS